MASRRRSIATALVALVLIGGAAAWWWTPAKQQPRFGRGGDDGPVPVVAALTKRSDVPVYLDGVGTIRALNTVTVRSQVDGKLLSVNYTEGQQVERGYVLAQIDPTIYQAAYDQAVAKKALDEATLANARLDLERYNRLAASNSVPRQQLDTQKMTVAQQEAQVKRLGRPRQPRHVHQRGEPGAVAAAQRQESLGDEGAVKTLERHDVGDRAERDQIEQVDQARLRAGVEEAPTAQRAHCRHRGKERDRRGA